MRATWMDGALIGADGEGEGSAGAGRAWGPRAAAFLHGFSLFETMLWHGRGIFGLDAHLERLLASGKTLGFFSNPPWPKEYLRAAIMETAGAALAGGETALRIRLTAARGSYERDGEWHAVVTADPYPAFAAGPGSTPYDSDQPVAWKAVLSPFCLDPASPLSGHKTGNHLLFQIACQDALRRGADEAVILTNEGFVAEGSRSNIFLVSAGELVTPPLALGVLPGITRAAIFRVARDLGITVCEEAFRYEDLQKGEVFFTNSLVGVVPAAPAGDPAFSLFDPAGGRVSGDGPVKAPRTWIRIRAAYLDLSERESERFSPSLDSPGAPW
ncbi:MAG: aminotransferase class IV [Firmicutes bacterium]|nr:aminotransferase class IV [Bacillota bacterium]